MSNKIKYILLFLLFNFFFCPELFATTPNTITPSSIALNPETLIAQAKNLNLHQDKEWLRLLHYIDDPQYGWLSEVDGKKFFLSQKGNKNSQYELDATIRQIFSGTPLNDNHPRCKFPARYEYLSRKLNFNFNTLPETDCKTFTEFKTNLSTDSVAVVFSSYYMNNPSSTFGHTLLRMNKNREANMPSTELLDFGINFGANPWTENPLLYTYGGIVGWFPGTFSNIPYHIKVREYNDNESRDLWSYTLNLSEKNLRQLERHLWELGDTYFDYYFFTENCSYHLLRAVEASAPEWDLTKDLHHWVIPSDTILSIFQKKGLVKEVSYRPSNLKQFLTRYEQLTEVEQNIFHKIRIQKENANENIDLKFANLSNESSSHIQDALIDFYEFKNAKELLNIKSDASKFKLSLLSARAQNPVISNKLIVTEPKQKPHEAHSSMRVGLEAGYEERLTDFQNLHFRFAMHDLLDPDYGYPENAQIEFLNIIMTTFNEGHNHKFEKATLVGVKSLSPRTFYSPNLSWTMELGAKTIYDKQCTDICNTVFFQNAWGLSFQFMKNTPLTLFALGEYEFNFSDSFEDDSFRVLIGPRIGALFKVKDNLKFLTDIVIKYDPIQDYSFYESQLAGHYAFTKKYSVRVGAKNRNDDLESSVAFFWYP